MAKDAVLNVRLSSVVKDALVRAAAADDRSASAMVVRILRAWLTAKGHLPAAEAKKRSREKARR
jgi:hypothetical protein